MVRARLLSLVLAAAVGWFPNAPPEHVHAAEDQGHAQLVLHRHPGTHTLSRHAAHHDGTLDHDDPPILTLDEVYTLPAAPPDIHAPAGSEEPFVEPPVEATIHRTREYVERLSHGPPRAPASLRAPPAVSRL